MARRPKSIRADGRRLRGGRTRRRLVEAYLGLVEEGEPRPRAAAVAARAGVSLRTVYHHFDHLADLATIALASGSTDKLESMPALDSGGTLTHRVGALVHARGELFDAAAGIGLATVAVGQPTRSLETGVRGGRSVLRRQIEHTFEPELADPAVRAPEARALADAVDAVASADTWAYLRGELGRSQDEAEEVVAATLTSLLTPPQTQRHRATAR
jgi:TetR/AcrR family transcriptional regulator of autoinduction and epiphytic fitness